MIGGNTPHIGGNYLLNKNVFAISHYVSVWYLLQ